MKKALPFLCLLILFIACNDNDKTAITSISLDINKMDLYVGDTYQFSVSYQPSDADKPDFVWGIQRSSNEEIASIDPNGLFTAEKEGLAIVKVKAKGFGDNYLEDACTITINPVEGESMTLSDTNIEMNPGETTTLRYTISPDNATNKSVECKSSDPKIVDISYGGFTSNIEITAKGQGEATITVSLKDNPKVSATCKVKVGAAKLESISFEEKEKTIMQGESTKLNLVFTPSYATNKNVQWTSSNKNIATIDKEGNVTGIHFGECTITAKAEDGGFEATCKIIVKPIPVEGISFSSRYYYIEIGGERQLEIVFTPENAGNRNLTWSSSNPIAVSVDKTGKVKGNTSGNSTITAVSEDGDATHNPEVIMRVVDMMDQYNIGYGSVNHNRNRCLECGHENSTPNLEECPKCGSKHIDKLQRITGYLVGTTDRWNNAKLAELNDRVVHN